MTNSAKIRKTFEQNGGIFRLAPNWVPRSFCIPGRRIKLHPDDYYALGGARGGIDERWLGCTTPADNGPLTGKNEGISHLVTEEGECIPLTDTDSEVTLVCNDEGKLLNLTPNRLLWNGADYLAGPGFIAGTDGEGNLASLPPQEMNYYAKKFRAFLIAL